MIEWLKKLAADMNGTPDEARVALLLGCLAVIGFQGWNIYQGHPFDPSAFALGYGGVVGAFGLSVRARGQN